MAELDRGRARQRRRVVAGDRGVGEEARGAAGSACRSGRRRGRGRGGSGSSRRRPRWTASACSPTRRRISASVSAISAWRSRSRDTVVIAASVAGSRQTCEPRVACCAGRRAARRAQSPRYVPLPPVVASIRSSHRALRRSPASRTSARHSARRPRARSTACRHGRTRSGRRTESAELRRSGNAAVPAVSRERRRPRRSCIAASRPLARVDERAGQGLLDAAVSSRGERRTGRGGPGGHPRDERDARDDDPPLPPRRRGALIDGRLIQSTGVRKDK